MSDTKLSDARLREIRDVVDILGKYEKLNPRQSGVAFSILVKIAGYVPDLLAEVERLRGVIISIDNVIEGESDPEGAWDKIADILVAEGYE